MSENRPRFPDKSRLATLAVEGRATQRSVLDALEALYPVLRGTVRDHATQQRRPMLRFFACEENLSFEPPDAPRYPTQLRREWNSSSSWGR